MSQIAEQNFKNQVGLKFQLYNSLFTSLPFHSIEKTNIRLMMFLDDCEEGYQQGLSPTEIVEKFFQKFSITNDTKAQTDLLFRFVQYVERQVVLFDAMEDAAFRDINDFMGMGSLKQLETEVKQEDARQALLKKLEDFAVTLVLTAHPTQFYPGTVLGIINDLAKALKDNNTNLVNLYLQQLGKTPLLKKEKPTPYEEAISLVWYLENIFYNAVGRIISLFKSQFKELDLASNPIVKMGFWPGGDRDGNPNVNCDTTLRVADALRTSIIKCYYLDVRKLKRRLTFKGIDNTLALLEQKLYNNVFIPGQRTQLSQQEILESLYGIREVLVNQHDGLFLHLLDDLIHKVEVFGLHFASLDIRQDSSILTMVMEEISKKEGLPSTGYMQLSEQEKMKCLASPKAQTNPDQYEGIVKDSLESFRAISTIQSLNGPRGSCRYIISQCNSALNVMEVYGLFLMNGWQKEQLAIDIVPLFETIDDLRNAKGIMKSLYENEDYFRHLTLRNKTQTIMVGFSDGTKDGGYLMANWSIYKAKEELTAISRSYGIDVIFFDGRGGPPARGGGKTHKFYASMGRHISTKEIQLTIQGQTVSSSFGTIDAAQFNMEQLVNAGITNDLFKTNDRRLSESQEETIQGLADISYRSYTQLKDHPQFLRYLEEVSPLHYYTETNISSRPSKKGKSTGFSLKDLRAIPFVGAWSQLKQNVPGFYGLGTALKELDGQGKLEEIQELYRHSLYIKTLIDNCEMAMKKSFFPLTAYLSKHPDYGELWNMIHEEYELTKTYLFKLSGQTELMADYPVDRLSIQMREKIILPITTIQQYALSRLRDQKNMEDEMKLILERLVVRTSFGIINAGRNSV